MIDNYFDSEIFDGIDFTKEKIIKGEYIDCVFEHCNFENVHISNIQFIGCEFIDCNLSNVIVTNTSFKEIQFTICKMIGVKFNECNPLLLQMSFTICNLSYSSFYQLKIPNSVFNECKLEEVDFTETNLTGSWFNISELKNTIFDSTNLEKANFITSINFSIDPEINKLKGAKFSRENVMGLLVKYGILVE